MIIKSIGELLSDQQLVTIEPGATVDTACRRMSDHDIGALAVTEAGRMCGILSERDVIRRCSTAGRAPETTPVSDIMTPDPITIGLQDSLAEAMTRMLDGHFRHLPVIDSTQSAVGMLSMRDIPTEYRIMVERFRDYRGINGQARAAQ